MTPTRRERIISVLNQRQPDLTVITDAIVKARNLAAIVRTCDAVGIPTIHCVQAPSEYRSYSGTSASANHWVEACLHDQLESAINAAKSAKMQIIAANLSESAVDYRRIDYTKPTALLMGAELEGLSAEALSFCDHEVTIPMMGMVESYNVSVACAIILVEARNQRHSEGFYHTRRFCKEEFDSLFFKWAYPKLAEYCQQHDLDYPPLDENGELISGTAPSARG